MSCRLYNFNILNFIFSLFNDIIREWKSSTTGLINLKSDRITPQRSYFFIKGKNMKDFFNKRELLETIEPVIENTAMRYGLVPLEILFEKENNKWFLRIFIWSNNHNVSHLDCENKGMSSYLFRAQRFYFDSAVRI